MMHKQMLWRALALAVPATIVLVAGGLAPTAVNWSDNFNNNSFANFWSDGTFGAAYVGEVDQRLTFGRTGNTGLLSSAGLLFNRYGVNWNKNAHFEFDYRLVINNISAPRQFFLGTALAVEGQFPEIETGVAMGLLRDIGGLWVGVIEFKNGNIAGFDGVPITQKTGRIECDWNKSMDQFRVRRSGGAWAVLSGYHGNHGALYGTQPMAITVGVIAFNGNVNFTGDRTYIDDWEGTFYKRAWQR